MKLYTINDLSKKELIDVLKNNIKKEMFTNGLEKNYTWEDRNRPGNLFKILEEGRYIKGCYYIIVDESGNYVGSGGWNEYPYLENTALIATRTFIVPKYRTEALIGKILLPPMIENTKDYENVYMTFNDCNRAMYDFIVRYNNSGRIGSLNKVKLDPIWKKFYGVGTMNIYNVSQWALRLNMYGN